MQRFGAALAATLLLALLSIQVAFAAPVSPARARLVAINALNTLRSRAGLAPLDERTATVSSPDGAGRTTWLYVVSLPREGGFAVVSGDDVGMPLLGYALRGSIDAGGRRMPSNLRKWFESYREQIRRAALRNPTADPATRAEWERLERGESTLLTSNPQSAGPLVATQWDQSPNYNAACPYDNSSGQYSVTGCVATAMAQVMKFWNYPEQGEGLYSYAHDVYGTLSANFGGTQYQWSQMPNKVTGPNAAVATLMYHCGVSVEMGYSPQESGAWVIDDGRGRACTETALKRFFRYDPATLRGISRSDYSYSGWTSALRSELDAGRPIIYDGFGSGGGHCFVCDGYQNSDYFHMNWGWSGYYDGYFMLDALNPDGVGTGGGDGGYNSGQEAVIGIKPLTGGTATPNLKLNADLNVTTGTNVVYGGSISIKTDVLNAGTGNFQGDFCAAAFDSEGRFADYIGIKRDWGLQGNNYHYTNGITFDTSGLFRLIPGTYTVAIFSRPTGGEWSALASTASFTNAVEITVTNDYSLALDEAITITSPNDLHQGGAFTATANIYNGLSAAFKGTISLNLYAMDGSYAATIGSYDGIDLPAGYHFNAPLEFSTSSLTVEPGSYLVAVLFQVDGSSNAYLVGNGSYINPITVVVQAADILADSYEPDDQLPDAARLVVGSGGGTVGTNGANAHTGSDDDWYRIDVPSGKRYSIRAHVLDSYTNPNDYTNDVLFSTVLGTDTSDVYDTEMPDAVLVNGGQTIYFHVAPYFPGDRGTYRLEVEVSDVSGVDRTPTLFTEVRALPNPATDAVTLQLPTESGARRLQIVNASGATVRSLEIGSERGGAVQIDLAGLPAGWYTVLATTERGSYRASFMKAE